MHKLITFSNTDSLFDENLLLNEAKNLRIFNEYKCYTEKDFSNDYLKICGNRFNKPSRGFGYWSWKSYIIKDALSSMNDGDILMYADAGYGVVHNNTEFIIEVIDACKNASNGILCLSPVQYREDMYSKMDAVEYVCNKFGVEKSYLLSENPYQYGGGILMFKKCPECVSFVDEWFDMCNNHYELINDEPSKTENAPIFVDNRHDQTAYSLLYKVYKCDDVDNSKTWTSPFSPFKPLHRGHEETYRKYNLPY